MSRQSKREREREREHGAAGAGAQGRRRDAALCPPVYSVQRAVERRRYERARAMQETPAALMMSVTNAPAPVKE